MTLRGWLGVKYQVSYLSILQLITISSGRLFIHALYVCAWHAASGIPLRKDFCHCFLSVRSSIDDSFFVYIVNICSQAQTEPYWEREREFSLLVWFWFWFLLLNREILTIIYEFGTERSRSFRFQSRKRLNNCFRYPNVLLKNFFFKSWKLQIIL